MNEKLDSEAFIQKLFKLVEKGYKLSNQDCLKLKTMLLHDINDMENLIEAYKLLLTIIESWL